MSKAFDPVHAAANGYTLEDWEEVSDNPELTAEELAQMRPMSEAMPELHAAIVKTIRARGPSGTKATISILLDDDMVAKLRASGPGWQDRVNDALRKLVDEAA